ncbi:HET-domain-containing protein, partial [Trametes versicolor FP-101664 SS1]|uniref:HET-domain-containing protein n=1 Tax=Trametes versicolor (strain FP-101664) TaxID=717944 RepID=UPI00046227A9
MPRFLDTLTGNFVWTDNPQTVVYAILSHTWRSLSDKIKRACEVARNAGYRLIWNDACCIDKSSSAELTEAINSMFELYKNADICYTFLADVPDGDIPSDISSQFRSSRWHTRGWTLQELIAPKRMVFLTKSWHFAILTGRVALDSISAARRMSWASGRQTTRVEDRAYSLMG